MTKQEFLAQLAAGLTDLTESDAQERLNFYSEMIDDRIEEGLSEQDAVAQIGDVKNLVAAIHAEIPSKAPAIEISKQTLPKQEKKRLRAWQIVMLIVGAPLWVSLLAAGLVVLIALLAVLWSLVVSAWAVFASIAGSALGCLIGGPIYMIITSPAGGIAIIGAALVCAGLAIPAFYGCVAATKGSVWLTKTVCVAIFKFFFERGKTA